MNEAAVYSYVNMVLLSAISGLFGVVVLVGVWWAKDIHAKLSQATKAATVMEEWAKAHDRQDDSRHAENRERLDRTHSSVHELRNQISDFAMRVGIQTRRISKRDDESA